MVVIMIIYLPLSNDTRHSYESKNGWQKELNRFLVRIIKILPTGKLFFRNFKS